MADRLTQLQDALDTLLTQMYATLHYITTHHSYGSFPSQPSQAPSSLGRTNSTAESAPQSATRPPGSPAALNGDGELTRGGGGGHAGRSVEEDISQGTQNPIPDPGGLFESRLQELAQDVVVKEQQIEAIVDSLPGIGVSESGQMERIAELQKEMARVEGERREAVGLREELREVVDGWVQGVGRV